MKSPEKPWRRRWLRWISQVRFFKFGAVGFSETLVNLAVLYVGREFLFARVSAGGIRLNLSLVLAIFCATLNNFCWNRNWTWGDRKGRLDRSILRQFGKYALACWLGIVLQALFTNLFAGHVHYLIANVLAIGLAGVFNFLVNDWWTFGSLKLRRSSSHGAGVADPTALDPGESVKAMAHESR